MKSGLVIIPLLFSLTLFSQNFEKVTFDKSHSEGYYLALRPASTEIKGVMLLLPGFGENAESIFPQSKLPNIAYANNILTVAIAGGRKLYADESVINRLDDAIGHIKNRYNVPPDKFVIGGFSAGGTISLRYVQYCNKKDTEVPAIPQAVFTVDSPVDLFKIWDYFEREIRRNYSDAGVGEAKFISEIMLDEIGDPANNANEYNKLTPFNTDLEAPGNEKFLLNTAVRVYHDIDVEWQLKNRRRSLYDSNQLQSSELINRLLLLGNEKAEFLTARQPGYRSNGMRHPHSWSIVDEVDLVQWVLGNLE